MPSSLSLRDGRGREPLGLVTGDLLPLDSRPGPGRGRTRAWYSAKCRILGPALVTVLVFLLIRLNREYRAEAACLADTADGAPQAQLPHYSRRVVLLLVDDYDLATIAALKYARSLRPTMLRAVHFSLDSARADRLRRRWVDAGTGIPLELADCPEPAGGRPARKVTSGARHVGQQAAEDGRAAPPGGGQDGTIGAVGSDRGP